MVPSSLVLIPDLYQLSGLPSYSESAQQPPVSLYSTVVKRNQPGLLISNSQTAILLRDSSISKCRISTPQARTPNQQWRLFLPHNIKSKTSKAKDSSPPRPPRTTLTNQSSSLVSPHLSFPD